MNGMNVVKINQIMGKLFHALTKKLTAEVLEEVFARGSKTRLRIHDLELELEGFEQILEVVKRPEYRKYFHRMFHMLHSNACEERDGRFFGHWNAHSFLLVDPDEENGDYQGARFGYFRFEAEFIRQDNEWKILELDVRALVVFKKWPCPTGETPEFLHPKVHVPGKFLGNSPDEDTYIQLRNLMGRFVQEGPELASELLSRKHFSAYYNPFYKGEVVEDLEAFKSLMAEISNEEKRMRVYNFHMMAATPYFIMGPEKTDADGFFMAQMLHFVRQPDGGYKVCFWIGKIYVHCIHEDVWRFTDFYVNPMICLGESDFIINPQRPMAMRDEMNWRRAPKRSEDTAGHAADLFAAESILPQWTERLKRGDTGNFVELYMKNSCEPISMGMSGPRTYGYENVLEHTGVSDKILETGTRAKRFPQFHIGASPVAEVYDQGKYAKISWLDYGWGNIGYGVFYDEDETQRMYRPMVGQYYHSFVRDQGQWKMYEFGWKPLIQWLPLWEYDTEQVDGWASKGFDKPWPLPFEMD